MPAYTTEERVRKVLQENDLDAELGSEFVMAALKGQNEWLRKQTGRHWYDSSNTSGSLFTSARSVSDDVQAIPSTPHPSNRYIRDERRRDYPKTVAGPYTRVELAKRDVASLTTLEVRDSAGEVEDWTNTKTSGRGEAYYLQVDPEHGTSHVYLDAGELPALYDYTDAVVAAYDYGVDGIPDTIERAVAMRAASDLVLQDDVRTAIPDDGQLINLETRAQALRDRAEQLLGPYHETPIA